MTNQPSCVFPWKKPTPPSNEYPSSIKWSVGNSKYEIHSHTLDQVDVEDVAPHCMEVQGKVRQEVGNEAHLGQSYFKVFPRTLSVPLLGVWDQVIADLGPNPVLSVETFQDCVRAFVGAHSSDEDRHDLIQQLMLPTKPRDLPVQAFFYRLLELNSIVELLPGTESALTDTQLKQAFYDGMPSSWKDRFAISGSTLGSLTRAEVLRYFRSQERRAQASQRDAEDHPRRSKTKKRPPSSVETEKSASQQSKKTQSKTSSKKSEKRQKGRVTDDDPCPVHPGSGHTWGDCRANRYSKATTKSSRNSGKTKDKADKSADNFVADVISRDHANSSGEGIGNNCCFIVEQMVNIDNYLTSNYVASVHQNPTDGTYLCDAFNQAMEDCVALGIADDDILYNVESFNSQLNKQLSPILLMTVDTIQEHSCKRPLKALCDSGAAVTMINPSSIPTGAVPFKLQKPLRMMTGGGSIELKYGVKMKVIRFPELSPTRAFTDEVIAIINKHTGTHDVILGRDFLGAAGIVPNPATSLIQWDDLNCPWLPHDHFHGHNWTSAVRTAMEALAADPYLEYDSFSVQKGSKEILSSKYDQVSKCDAAQQQTHLPQRQRDQLADVLQHFTTLFSGKLGCYPHHKVHLELSENAKPFRCREYPIPHAHREVFKEELERLVKIGVLSRTTASKFLSPTFIVPKKDGRVRWVSDFRKLNSMITRKVYNLPRIQDILKRRSHYRYFTKLDISMQYYTFELDEASKDLCTIATPFGNFRYNRLPMGIKQSPDVAQQIMEDVLRDCPEVEVYIDDIGVFSNTWEEHMASLRKVLKILQDNNFTVNPLKCEWAVQETDWLGYWLTPTGIKPWKKKIDALLALQRPQSVTELRSFIGAVTFYRDMFPRRSHLLSPLTAQVGKRKLNWNDECEKSFKEIKSLLAKEAFLRYPDHNKPFHIYTDASDRQLGSVILQEGKPVAFFSRKLNSAQRNYTTGEKELLSIVETLKEYRTMLFGCRELHVYTDHKNLTFHNLQTQRVLRWRLFLEEYGPIFHYIKGNENTAADAFSRLTFSERQSDHPHGFKGPPEKPSDVLHPSFTEDTSDSPVEGYYSMVTDDPDLRDCFVHLPDQQDVPFQLDYKTIAEAQSRDAALQAEAQSQPMRIQKKLLAPGTEVFCHAQTIGGPWKIYLPTSLLRDTVRWYHLALGHCGISRLADTLRMHFHHPRLQQTYENEVSTCDPCQRLKNVGRGHGETASREASLLPWQDVAVDLIGPWTISVGNKKHTFSALTIIDMVTNLVEVIRIENKSAAHVAMHFENHWLSKYPRPLNVIHDQGGEFIGDDFQHRLRVHGINSKPITAKNPQANSVCERMHQAIGNTLRVLTTLQPPRGHSTAKQLVDTAIADTVYATRCTYSSVLKTTPGGLAFGRDMILNIPLITDLQQLQKRRQALIDQRLIAANTQLFSYDYAIGDKVLKLVYNPGKLEPRAKGPYPITRVHANGTLSIQLAPGVIERINMRRVKPYHE